jgi:hypothetical protein
MKIETLQEAKQAAFNGAVRGLNYQGWQQCRKMVGCAWNLGFPGVHCAVGWLIPWENQKNIKTGSSSRAVRDHLLAPPLVEWDDQLRTLLNDMQYAHDCNHLEMKERFQAIGAAENLEWPKDVPQ